MKKNLLFLLALCVTSALFISCKKDDDSVTTTPSNSTLILGKWEISKVSGVQDGVTFEFDYPNDNEACGDYYEFKTDGVLKAGDFDESCVEEITTGSWSINNDNNLILIEDGEVSPTKIITLNQNTLKFEVPEEDFTLVLKKI